jgi:hypothetical protein
MGQAQRSGLPVDRLPANTYAYFAWHGQAALLKGAPNNNLVKLWNDPDFLSLRKLLSQSLAGSGSAASDKSLPQADQDAIMDVLSGAGVVGAAGTFDLASLLAPGPAKKAKDSDFFMIWDASGKEAQWKRVDQLFASRATDKPAVTSMTLRGVQASRSETASRVSFSGMAGTWRIEAGRQALFEDLVARFQGSGTGAGLGQGALYQAGMKFRAESPVAEFAFKMPDFNAPAGPQAGPFDIPALLKAMHIDRLQGLVGSVGLSGTGTQMRTAIVGDTSAGSLFDLWGASSTTFGTLAAAPVGFSYSGTKIDLGAFYRTVRAALKTALPPDQFANVEMVEGMAAAQTNMPLVDLLSQIEEFATVSPLDAIATDLDKVMFAVRIKQPADLLALIRKTIGSELSADTTEGGITYLTMAGGPTAMNIAIGPQLLVIAPSKDTAKQAMARAAAGGTQPGSLAADAGFKQSRALFPAALTSLSYSDMSKFPWQAFFTTMGAALPSQAKPDAAASKTAEDVLQMMPKLLARYLHATSSASWKSAGGIFAEVRIQ